jgi:transposase
VLDIQALPDDVEDLKRLLIERESAHQAQLREKQHQIEHLKFQLAQLRRARFGQSSEQLEEAGQLPLTLGELQAALAQATREAQAPSDENAPLEKGRPVRRKQLPEHFERHDKVIEPKECVCPDCGGALKPLGKADESEVLEVKTVTFTVTRHIRPKKRCVKCSSIVQGAAPSRPIPKSFAGASLLALILTWKYGFHLPLYRQCQIFSHAGLNLSRTTLMQWVAATSELLGPLVAALAKHVLSSPNLNADDTPIKVLAPGTGKTKKGRLWTYVRDGRPWKSRDPPAVWYQYSPTWQGLHPKKHLADYRGKLQVDGYAGFDALFMPSSPAAPAPIVEVACAAHMRRKFFEVYVALKSPIAQEVLERFRLLYRIEDQIRGCPPAERLAVRQAHAVPLLASFHAWMIEKRGQLEQKSELAGAFDYALKHWDALLRYTQDGCLEMDNNAAERSIRGMGVGRKNYLFFGSDTGGERAAIIYSLVETCKLNHIDPQRYLRYVLEHIAEHPIKRIEELLPWNVADKLNAPPAQSLAAA